jgi:hypothetical protein
MSLQVFSVHKIAKIATNNAKLSSHFFLSSSVEPGSHDVSGNLALKLRELYQATVVDGLFFTTVRKILYISAQMTRYVEFPLTLNFITHFVDSYNKTEVD